MNALTRAEPVADDRIAKATQSRIDQLMAHEAISREIVVDQTATIAEFDGRRGLLLHIRLPSYRSLPLACIERIGVTVDGEHVDLLAGALRIENGWHPLSALPTLLDTWWFILDTAVLFVPTIVSAGRHQVAVEVVRVEPYITAGRFSFTDSSTATVFIEDVTNA